MTWPFEVDGERLRERLDEFVDITIAHLTSEFLVLPKGPGYLDYRHFRDAYELLRQGTSSFADFNEDTVTQGVRDDSRAFCVLRAVLGMTPPEWADLARTELDSDVTQGAARKLDRDCRADPMYFRNLEARGRATSALRRIRELISVAVRYVTVGAPPRADGVLHRLDKYDTFTGVESLQYAAREGAPYPVLLYERYMGRPFAGHRDAVSELIGEAMEGAIEDRLRIAGVPYRKTRRAERIPRFGQAPDFCIPDEIAPRVVIEAKITSDDGTARDKVARILRLVTQRNEHAAKGDDWYEVVACIDGRGFRQRREDMRQLLLALNGKVFTTATLDQLITHTQLREFAIRSS